MAIVLSSLSELRKFTLDFGRQSTRVELMKYEVIIPCASDRARSRLGRKTVRDNLSDREVVGVMRMLIPAHSKRSQHVRVF